jgi:hypothetical protein
MMTGKHWTWDQSAGVMTAPDGRRFGGYSGRKEGLNNPARQHVRAVGPIPQGDYDIGALIGGRFVLGQWRRSKKTGRNIFDLRPKPTNRMFGRSAFQIHGDNRLANFTASSGCIILDPAERAAIKNSGVFLLRVVA